MLFRRLMATQILATSATDGKFRVLFPAFDGDPNSGEFGYRDGELGSVFLDIDQMRDSVHVNTMNTHIPNSSLLTLQSIQTAPVGWLWPGYLPLGKLVLLDGDAGCGKSLLTIDLAARLSCGRPLPNGAQSPEIRRSLFLNAEDSIEDTLVPRLQAAGADLQHVMCMAGADGRRNGLQFPRDSQELESLLVVERIGLVVIDPLVAFMPLQSIRKTMSSLAEIAERCCATILLVRHLTKRSNVQALYRGIGPIDVVAGVRASLLACRHPDRPGFGILATSKGNLGVTPPSLCYEIIPESTTCAIAWHGPFGMNADQLVGAEPKKREAPSVLRACDWLLRYLAQGPRSALEVLGAAEAEHISERTLDRAKKNLGIQSKIESSNGRSCWMWMLPVPRPLSVKEKLDQELMQLLNDVYPPLPAGSKVYPPSTAGL